VASARRGLYTNLITSGVGLTKKTRGGIARGGAGFGAMSYQSTKRRRRRDCRGVCISKSWSGGRDPRRGIAFSLNVVLHRATWAVREIIDVRKSWATRLELANVQYYGWRLRSNAIAADAKNRWRPDADCAGEKKAAADKMEIFIAAGLLRGASQRA